jgi:putative membrane protein
MKTILSIAAVSAFALFATSSCTTTGTNTLNVNVNRASVNSVTNSLGNAANTVANTVGNVTHTTGSPEDFMKDAAIGGMTEVELGKLAAQKARNADVKKFAQMMVTDHSKANDELKSLAQKKNITLPSALDSDHQADVDELKSEAPDDFDKEYVEMMVDDHEKDVAEFERQSQNSPDADVKAFAAKTLPVLKKHLDAIKAIQAKMK